MYLNNTNKILKYSLMLTISVLEVFKWVLMNIAE